MSYESWRISFQSSEQAARAAYAAAEALQTKVEALCEALETCLEMEERPKVIERARAALAAAQQRSAIVEEALVERIAALLYEEATGDPWTVADIKHPGPYRDYYRRLARKVLALATQHQEPAT